MSSTGGADLLVAARGALLDALDALDEQLDAVTVVGAQAIYLHTGSAPVALAEATKDSDLVLDPRSLLDYPLLEDVMAAAGFQRNLEDRQPGSWLNVAGIPVDLMVPESLSGSGGRRGARIPPHSNQATRRAAGLEAALVDNTIMPISALDPRDHRVRSAHVAGPAALLIAKLHKLGERRATPGRLVDKDAHDLYRLLVATDTRALANDLRRLAADRVAGSATRKASSVLAEMFADGPDAIGAKMAGRAEEGVGDPAVVSASVAALASSHVGHLGFGDLQCGCRHQPRSVRPGGQVGGLVQDLVPAVAAGAAGGQQFQAQRAGVEPVGDAGWECSVNPVVAEDAM